MASTPTMTTPDPLRAALDETLWPYLRVSGIERATFDKMLDGVTARLTAYHGVHIALAADTTRPAEPEGHAPRASYVNGVCCAEHEAMLCGCGNFGEHVPNVDCTPLAGLDEGCTCEPEHVWPCALIPRKAVLDAVKALQSPERT